MRRKHYSLAIIFLIVFTVMMANCRSYGEPEANAVVRPPEVSAKNAIVIEKNTGKIIYEKNSREQAYPASITKIMTAMLTIESGNLDRLVKVPGSAVGVEGSSIYLTANERLSMRDLVYGLMLRSGNDAAVAISCLVEPSTDGFVERMNERAKEIGAMDTHFINPNGLFNEGHYTTAYDMAVIAKEAMKIEDFREVAKAKSWVADRGEGAYNYFYNKNKVIFDYPGGTGIKIGYTIRSGRTLVASAERDGMELICVVMNAPDWFNDSYKLMDYGFSCFKMCEIIESQRLLKAIPVIEGDKDHVFVGSKDPINLPVLKESDEKFEIIYRLPLCVSPPLRRWQQAGTIELYSEGSLITSGPLYFLEDISFTH